jgi:hypothetical protein
LTDLEESVIVQYILELDSKGFPPRLSGVEDMANRILAQRDAPRVGVNWASTFVKRHPELTTRFNRKYDYQRAQCEDPEIIRGWFALVRNTVAKYGIQEADIYNFDETGFSDGRHLDYNGCHKLRAAWQGKVEATWQSRVGNGDPGPQCYWLGDPSVLYRNGQASPLLLVR